MPKAVLKCRPIGVLMMEDEAGIDEKIIAVPSNTIPTYHSDVTSVDDIRPIHREQIEHFFQHYKDLEKGKWVKNLKWQDADKAREMILEGIERAK